MSRHTTRPSVSQDALHSGDKLLELWPTAAPLLGDSSKGSPVQRVVVVHLYPQPVRPRVFICSNINKTY